MSENTTTRNEKDDTSSLPPRQVPLLPPPAPPFYEGLHVRFLENLVATMDASFEGALLEHLRVSGVYWLQTAWCLLSKTPPMLQQEDLWDWIFSCYDEKSGGFGGHTAQDGHLLYTLSALQVLALGDRLSDDRLPRERVVQFIVERQSPDGSFTGDTWGETDTRFTYCALQSLALLQAIDRVDIDAACAYIMACRNADGSFGSIPGAESHAGQVFTCVGALAIAQRLHLLQNMELQHDQALAVWLSERQVDSGGLNGRPEKQADVCYSWWILSTLAILGKTRWVHRGKLAHFILSCQDNVDGGIADRPDDMADVYHTFFGIAGLSLLGYLHQETKSDKSVTQEDVDMAYQRIDPLYALPTWVVQKLGLPGQVIHAEGEPLDDRLTHYIILEDKKG